MTAKTLDPSACKRLFDLAAESGQPLLLDPREALTAELAKEQHRVLGELEERNGKWLDSEIEKARAAGRKTSKVRSGTGDQRPGQGDSRGSTREAVSPPPDNFNTSWSTSAG